MKKKLRGLIGAAIVGLLIALAIGLASGQERVRQDRFKEWSERRREAGDADARVALEGRLVKLEADQANYNRRLDWMEKVIWGAILGMVAMFGKEILLAYFNRQHRQDANRNSQAGPE